MKKDIVDKKGILSEGKVTVPCKILTSKHNFNLDFYVSK